MSGGRYRLGVDVGGTPTDLVLFDTSTGALMVEKVSSTPKNPALAQQLTAEAQEIIDEVGGQ